MTSDDPTQRLEREAEDLEHKGEHLEEHIDEAKRKAAEARNDDEAAGEEVVGDFEDTEPAPAGGDDPVGAADEQGDQRER
jgi:hypothetical protein